MHIFSAKVSLHVEECKNQGKQKSVGGLLFCFFVQRAALARISRCKDGCSVILVAYHPSDGQICCRWILTFQEEGRHNHVE